MIKGKTVLAVITARGGSKRCYRKNIRSLAGKPLIAWTIEAAKKSAYIDRLVLSSEDQEIIRIAQSWGCEVPFTRPVELARDDTPGVNPVIHMLKNININYDYIILLQPTSPLRTAQDIDSCLEFCLNKGAMVCISVCEVEKGPWWMYRLDSQNKIIAVLNEEIIAEHSRYPTGIFMPNGAVYVAESSYLLDKKSFITDQTMAYTMPVERSVDIDNEIDFIFCEALLASDKFINKPNSNS